MASRREEAALPLEAAELATGISLEVRWRLLIADLAGRFCVVELTSSSATSQNFRPAALGSCGIPRARRPLARRIT